MYARTFKPLKTRSFFLLGARGVGKTTLIESLFSGEGVLKIDLLDEDLNRRLLLNPKDLEGMASKVARGDWIIVDEIQKNPALLNHVQRLIDQKGLKFALTGSSARKLKRNSANLLGGRAHEYKLFPFTWAELGESFDLKSALELGLLPSVWQDSDRESQKDYLRGYANIYIRQEIKEEQVVRKLEPFLYFIETAAQSNGEPINFSKIAKQAGVDHSAVERYYQILEDTLLGFFLPSFDRSVRAQQLMRKKFYFFDTGVCRSLAQTLNVELEPSTSEFGRAFESFVVLEIMKLNFYFKKDFKLSYIRTKDDVEIDLVVETPRKELVLVEIKSSDRVDDSRLTSLVALKKSMKAKELWVFSRDPVRRGSDDWTIWPWQSGLQALQKI